MIEMCSRRLEWCVLLVLVGEGQEINTGGNSGIQQWDEAIKRSEKEWEIICPAKLDSYFKSKKVDDDRRNNLDLSVSLRSHMAENVNRFANQLLNGQIEEASKLTESIYPDQFDITSHVI